MQTDAKRFVVLVFIGYNGWYRKTTGHSMELRSTTNDLVPVLDHLSYRHDDEEMMWHILTDFDLEYTDVTGSSQPLRRVHPTRKAILNALKQAGLTGASGLVYFGGHGEYEPSGASVLNTTWHGGRTAYSVKTRLALTKRKRAFFLAIDGGRIYGEDILSRLPENGFPGCIHTVVLDSSHSSAIIEEANLPYVYDGSALEGVEDDLPRPNRPRSSKQLITITAAREGELSGVVRPEPPNGPVYGNLTWYMIHWLNKYPHANAENLAARLAYRCTDAEPPHRPQIKARYPLTDGGFRLLPDTVHSSGDDN